MFCPGIVRRRCIGDDDWEEFFECFRDEIKSLLDQVIFLTDYLLASYVSVYLIGHEPYLFYKWVISEWDNHQSQRHCCYACQLDHSYTGTHICARDQLDSYHCIYTQQVHIFTLFSFTIIGCVLKCYSSSTYQSDC